MAAEDISLVFSCLTATIRILICFYRTWNLVSLPLTGYVRTDLYRFRNSSPLRDCYLSYNGQECRPRTQTKIRILHLNALAFFIFPSEKPFFDFFCLILPILLIFGAPVPPEKASDLVPPCELTLGGKSVK